MTELEAAKNFGPVALFALLVLYLLREITPVLKAIKAELFEMRLFMAAILERDRIRSDRRKREASTQPPIRGRHVHAQPPPKGDFEDGETTNIQELIEIQREAASKPRGERAPRKGTHHDED